MFIKINDVSTDFFNELKKYKGKNIVIHYRCWNCNNEQVTYETEIDKEVIGQFQNNGSLIVVYNCIECGAQTLYLGDNNIFGIEII
jgi:DNA-directed RNA polymerase subunit RPC12/RpoP